MKREGKNGPALPDAEDHGTLACDRFTSSDSYASRFEGSVGERLLRRQAGFLEEELRGVGGKTVLDVGGGHGQSAGAVTAASGLLTVHGSSGEAFVQLDRTGAPLHERSIGPLAPLPFPDGSFHTVISLRTVPHVPDWRAFIAELTRVASDRVLFDFAPAAGLGRVEGALFGWKKKVERNTRPYERQSREEVRQAVEQSKWRVHRMTGQYLLPFALHRLFPFPVLFPVEDLFRAVRITGRRGAPVLVSAHPNGS